ncbi:hypothetical protein Bbelb_219850 [Branchiostoma belcheri]|nr:hypothetical protein Bbelb_219850 [Branchiostoma belcheri]
MTSVADDRITFKMAADSKLVLKPQNVMKAAQLSGYPASSPTHGSATLANLDKLIQNLEFENKQQVKLIEKENEEREEFERQTKEKKEEITSMQKSISQMDEDTKRLHRQFKYNRDNVGSLKRTCQLLYEHEEALKHKLEDVTNAGEKQRTDCAKMLEHFQNVWAKHQEVYENMPKVKTLRERQAALHNLQDTIKQAIQRIEVLNRTIRSLENPAEEASSILWVCTGQTTLLYILPDALQPSFSRPATASVAWQLQVHDGGLAVARQLVYRAELKVDTAKNVTRINEWRTNIRKLEQEIEGEQAERDRIIKEREAEQQRCREEEEARKEREREQAALFAREREAQQHTSVHQEATSQYFPPIFSQSNLVAAPSLHPGAPPSSVPATEDGTPPFTGGLGAKGPQAFPLLQPVQRKSPPKITIPTLMCPQPRPTPQPRQVPSFNFQHKQLPVVQQKPPLLQVYRPNIPAQQPLLRQVQELQLRQRIDFQPTGHSPTKLPDYQALEGSPARMGDHQELQNPEDSTAVATDPMTPGPVSLPGVAPDNNSAPVTPGNSAPVTPANSNPSTPGEGTGSTSTSPFNFEKHRQHLLQLTSTSPGFSMPSRPMYQAEGGERDEESQATPNAGRNFKVEEESPFMQSFFTGFGGEPVGAVGSTNVPIMSSSEQQLPNTSVTSTGSPNANNASEQPPTSKGSPFFKGVPSPPSATSFFSSQNISTSVSDSFSLGSVPPMSSGAASLFGGGDSTTTTSANDGGSFFGGFGGSSEKSSSACNLFGSGSLFGGGGDNSSGSNSPQGFSFNFGGGSSPNNEAGTSGFSLFG